MKVRWNDDQNIIRNRSCTNDMERGRSCGNIDLLPMEQQRRLEIIKASQRAGKPTNVIPLYIVFLEYLLLEHPKPALCLHRWRQNESKRQNKNRRSRDGHLSDR